MSKKEVKELQESLLELVPYNVRNSKELTRSSKILLGNFIFLNGMDKAKENGYVFRSNKLLKDDTKLSNKTIIKNISKLIQLGFITRSTGNRVDGASTYILNYEILNSYQGCNFKGVISKKTTPINYTNKLEDKINAMSLEIKELKSMVKELMGVISDMGVKINYTTDTDIDPEKEINKNITNVNNIKPEVIKHEVNIKTYINSDENKNINTETNVTTENDNNINIDNSNSNTLKNSNNMKETNNDTNVNNATLSEILEKQALDNYEAFDSSNVVVCDASSIETVNKYPQEEQKHYQRLYTKTYDLIKEWYKSHDSVISSRIESNIRVINMMYEDGYISRKQLEASENNLKNYFNKLMDGWLQIIKERHTSFSNKDPQPHGSKNDQMEEVV